MVKSMWIPDHDCVSIPKPWPLTQRWFSFAPHSLRQAFHLIFWTATMGFCAQSGTRALVRSSSDVWIENGEGLVHSQHSSSSWKWSEGAEVKNQATRFFYRSLGKICLYEPLFVHKGTVMLEQVCFLRYHLWRDRLFPTGPPSKEKWLALTLEMCKWIKTKSCWDLSGML